jgi:hypothetical protein
VRCADFARSALNSLAWATKRLAGIGIGAVLAFLAAFGVAGARNRLRDLVVGDHQRSDEVIDYQFVVDDPVYCSQTWAGQIPLRKSKDKVFEYACHEGNYALPGILRGMVEGRDTAIEKEGE